MRQTPSSVITTAMTGGTPMRALVVVETSGTRNLIYTILDGMGFEVDTVSDGMAAYVLLSSLLIGRYDIVFLDAYMHEWNGMDILGFHEEKNGKKNIIIISDILDDEIQSHPNVYKIMSNPVRSQDVVGIAMTFMKET